MRSLVIVDSSVDNLELLKSGLEPGAEMVVLHPQFNGIEQITSLISRRQNLQKVHLVSHGGSGSLRLGNSELSIDNIDEYSTQLQTWFGSGGDRVSLLVYGCQVAAYDRGKSFVQKLHQLTGANLAASTRTVGSATHGGVWQLDYTVGAIEPEFAFSDEVIQTYSGIFQDEEAIEESTEDSTPTNFEGAEIQQQSFIPNRETPASEPVTEVVGDDVEFTFGEEIQPNDIPDDDFVIVDVDIDITPNSIIYQTGENQTPTDSLPGEFNGDVFTDVSGDIPDIVGATIDESATTYDLEPEDVTFTEDTVEIDFAGLDVDPGLTAKIDVEFGEPGTESEPSVEEEPAAEEPVADAPVEEVAIEEPVVDADTAEIAAEEVAIEEPLADAPVEEVAVEEGAEDGSTLTNFEGAEIQIQAFFPNRETPTSEPITEVVGEGVEFTFADDIQPSDFPGDNVFIADNSLDFTENSIIYQFGEDQTPFTGPGEFNGYVFSDASGELPPIVDVTIDESVTTYGLEQDDITFTEDTIEINEAGLDVEPGLITKLDVEFGEPGTESEPVADAPVEEVAIEEPVADAPVEEVAIEEPVADAPVEEVALEEPVVDADTAEIAANEVIDLTTVAEGESVFTVFNVNREAEFENTVDFYEVSADGSVVDDSGETIAIGEEGYTEAAVDNRVGLELSTENGTVSEFSTELEGGKIYAPLIAVDSSIEALSDDNPNNDPTVYFTYPEANADGFDHVRSFEANVFEFEDLANGGDVDFNDVVVGVSLDSTGIAEAPVEEPVAEEPVAEEPVSEEPVEEVPVEEVVNEPVVEEEALEESSEYFVVSDNFEGAEIQLQIFAPDLESPTSEPITAVVGDGVEFDDDLPPSDNPGDNLFPANVDIDLSGGVAGEGNISFEVDEDQEPDTFVSGNFNGYVFTDVSDNLAPIENVTIDESINTLGLEPSDVTFSEDTIEVNVESIPAEPGLNAFLNVDFAEEPVVEEESVAEEPVIEEPVEETPVEEPVAEEPVAEEPVEEAPVEEVVNEPVEEPVLEEPVEESLEDSVVSDNFEGAEIELQIFGPTLDDPAGEPLTATVGEGFEFEQNTVESSDIPGDQIFIVDVDIDISGGGAGEGSIFFEVNEDEEPGNFLSGDFSGYVFTDTSDNLAPIENVTLNDGVTTLEGLDSSAISFDENTIRLDVANLRYEPGRTWQLDVEFADV